MERRRNYPDRLRSPRGPRPVTGPVGPVSRAALYLRRLLETHPRNIYPCCAGVQRDMRKERRLTH